MKTKFLLLSGFAALLCPSCTGKNISKVILSNPTENLREDEAGVIERKKLENKASGLVPILTDANGAYLPCQLDDLDGDGQWDELAFVCNLTGNEKKTLQIEWISKDKYPSFRQRTQVHFGKMVRPGVIEERTTDMHGKEKLPRGGDPNRPYPYQTDGPSWENDKMGFRHYFDGRNCRDVFGKRIPDLVLDTVGIRPDGTPGDTYHQLREWGRDIMSAAGSFGLGGIAVQLPDTLLRLGVTAEQTTDNVDSTRYTLVCKGPVRSIFKLDFYGWQVGTSRVDVHEKMTIWAGKYGYENEVSTSPLPPQAVLVSGIVGNFNDMPQRFQTYQNKLVSMSTHDKQTYNKEWYMGMSLIIPLSNYAETLDAPKEHSDIVKTWCVRLKPDQEGKYRFNAYAAWELSKPSFANRDSYMHLIDTYAENQSNPVRMELQ